MEEHVERVPWAVLESRERVARWWWYLGGTVLLVAALSGGLVYATASDGSEPTFDSVSTMTLVSSTDEAASVSLVEATSTTVAAVDVATIPASSIYSEADLLALVDDGSDQLVAAAAEVFVHRYFTRSDERYVSHVEWTRAIRIDAVEADGFAVAVVFSTIAGPAQGPFSRLPLRAVEIDVEMADDSAKVVGLPKTVDRMPIESATPVAEILAVDAVPTEAILAAQTAAAHWGVVEILGGWYDQTWTVLVAVTDAAGVRWELGVETAIS